MFPISRETIVKDLITAILAATQRGSSDIVKLLIEVGADISRRNCHNSTALHLAARYGHYHIIGLLLDNGTEISCKDLFGATPLHNAAKHGYVDCTELLLRRGASWIAKTNDGQQPIHLAGERGHKEIFNILRVAAGKKPVQGDSHDLKYDKWDLGFEDRWDDDSPLPWGPKNLPPAPRMLHRTPGTNGFHALDPYEAAYWN